MQQSAYKQHGPSVDTCMIGCFQIYTDAFAIRTWSIDLGTIAICILIETREYKSSGGTKSNDYLKNAIKTYSMF